MDTKPLQFVGSSRDDLRDMPSEARQDIGYALSKLQSGEWPSDTKPFNQIGPGTHEIRVRDDDSTYRTFFVAKFPEAIYVLHAFVKKTQKTPQREIALAQRRYQAMIAERGLGLPAR